MKQVMFLGCAGMNRKRRKRDVLQRTPYYNTKEDDG